jgi:hypothetical protein
MTTLGHLVVIDTIQRLFRIQQTLDTPFMDTKINTDRRSTIRGSTCIGKKESNTIRGFENCIMFGFRSNSSTLLVRVTPGQPGVAPRQLRAPGRGATALDVGRRRCRETSPSHRTWAGHSLRGSIIMVRIFPFPTTEDSNAVIKPEQRKRELILLPVYPDQSMYSYFPTLLHPCSSADVFSSAHRNRFNFPLHRVYEAHHTWRGSI